MAMNQDGFQVRAKHYIPDGAVQVLDQLELCALDLLHNESISPFHECQQITNQLKDLVISWMKSVPEELDWKVSDKILSIVAIVAQLSRRRIFQYQGKDDEFCLNLVELDKIKSDVNDMIVLGKYLPKLDSALLMPFSDLISTAIKSYVDFIDMRRQAISSQTGSSIDDLADEKRNFNSSLSITAFRLRHLSNYFMDLISLQTPFTFNGNGDISEVISTLKGKMLVLCQCESKHEILVFVSPALLQDRDRAERFCYSNVNTSPDMSQDLIVTIPNFGGLSVEPEVNLSSGSILESFALSGNFGNITVAAKSIVALRLISADLQKIGKVFMGSSLTPLRVSERTEICFGAIGQITNHLADLCMQISMSLALLQDEDRESYARRGLDIEADYMIMTAVGYAFQFLLDAPFASDHLQKTFELHVSRALHWLGVCCRDYIVEKDTKFCMLVMTVVLEYLNSLFYQDLYTIPKSWEKMISELENQFNNLTNVMNANENLSARAFIIDQGQTMLRRLGRGCRRRRERSAEKKYPDQSQIEARNMYILAHTLYSNCDIYKCLDLITRKLVIVKKIPRKFLLRKFGKLSELDFLKALRNINIVNYLGSFESKDYIFLKMEYCDSQILPNGINKKCEKEARMIGRQILLGLCYLHANHIIHRDIKPGNVLMNGAGFVKIADFGEAQLSGDLKKDGKFDITELYGTPLYMAPECLHSWNVGTLADIWSFGCLMARLISGQEPWIQCAGKFQVLYQLGSSNDSPFEIDSLDCSDECKTVITSCLQRDPELRPTAVQLLNFPYFSDLPDSFV